MESEKNIKLPKIIKSFMLCYIGGYGLINSTIVVGHNYIFLQILVTAVCSFIFAYGFISMKEDYKNGGLKKIWRKMKNRKNDNN